MKLITILLTLVLLFGHKQPVYAQQIIPGEACLLANNNVLLASTAYPYFYTQKQLVLSLYNPNGEILKKQFFTIDTLSVEKIGGVFMHNDTTIAIFCTFASINNLKLPKHWGYVLFNNQWQMQSHKVYTIWFSKNDDFTRANQPFVIDFLRIKKDSKGQYYGNAGARISFINYPTCLYLCNDYVHPQYNNWVRLSPQLELLNNFPDTGFTQKGAGDEYYSESFLGQGAGDIIETNSSYLSMVGIIISTPGQVYTNIIHKDSFTKNTRTGGGWTIRESLEPSMNPNIHKFDTIQYIRNHTPFFYSKKLSEQSTLVGFSGQFRQQRKVDGYWIDGDTGAFYDSDRGFILKLNDTGGVVNYVYDIPADTETFIGINNPARQRCLDFYTPNNIYFSQTEDVSNYFLPEAWNRIWVTLVDSNLNKKWVKCITHPNRYVPNREYIEEHLIAQTIQATADGGCLVFASIAYRHFTDTTYYQDAAFGFKNPYWETIVYKLMPDGSVYTGNVKIENTKQKIIAYPNPTSDYLNITSDNDLPVTCELLNLQGQPILKSSFNKHHKIDVSNIVSGVYLIKCTTQNNEVSYQKIIISH